VASTEPSTYEITEVLRESERTLIYRGFRRTDHLPVVLKVLRPRPPHPGAVDRLENEYRIAREVDTAAVVQPLALARVDGMTALVLEDFGGTALSQLLGEPMEPARFLHLAVAAAAALAELHRRGVIHRDIKPDNILVNEATGALKISDLGIASFLPREQQPTCNPALIEGTLAYMSPEQTGRMHHAVDQRTDLYSLGVTFYEMLTGRLPFLPGDCRDALEWVHCHIARLPPPPAEVVPAVPEALSRMVMKLLSKAAEDRYQSAAGLENDLQECLEQWESAGRIALLALGQRDVPDRFSVPQKLYGRAEELAALLEAFQRVVTSAAPELVLIAGYSGVGKSSLVQELHKPVVEKRGFFVSGKFDQQKRNIPYSSFVQAFRDLIVDILTESDERVAAWRQRLQSALGANGQLIVDVIPQVELIVGKQAPVVELPPSEAQLRFKRVFQRFIAAFAARHHPLVLFIDDLQWADPASLELIEQITTSPDMTYLLLIGAYRENEVHPGDPLATCIGRIREMGAIGQQLALAPLSQAHLGELVSDTLHCSRAEASSLAELVHEKTAGNPFFAIHFLTRLHQDGLLAFDLPVRAWRWDVQQIGARGYTDNVADLMVAKLQRLPQATREAMTLAACAGDVVDVAILALIAEASQADIERDLRESVREGLMKQEGDSYRFLHDRIRQAAYSLLAEAERPDVHLRIARLLVAHSPPEKLGERIFEITSHFALGVGRIRSDPERAEVASLFLRAGRKAKASTAYQAAVGLLATGTGLLSEASWENQYQLTYDLYFERAECEWLSGGWEEADRRLAALLARARTNLDKLAVHGLKAKLHTNRGEWEQAVQSALDALRIIGVKWSPHPRLAVLQAYAQVWQRLGDRSIEELIDLPPMTDPEMKAAMAIASGMPDAAAFTDPFLVALVACFMADSSLSEGNAESSAHGYALFGMLSEQFGRFAEGYRFGRLAHELVEREHNLAYKTKVAFFVGNVVNFWVKPYRSGIEQLEIGVRTGLELGDILWASYCSVAAVLMRYLGAEPLAEVHREAERHLDSVRKVKFEDIEDLIISIRQCAQNLRGLTADLSTLSGDGFDEAIFECNRERVHTPLVVCWYSILKLQARVITGDYAQAMAAAAKANEILMTNRWFGTFPEFYYYHALAIAARCDDAAAPRRKKDLKALAGYEGVLRVWATSCPENFASKHALVAAEIARLKSRNADAMRLYEQAIRAARTGGLVQNEALAYETAARFYRTQGLPAFAELYLREARNCYLRWGANGKVRQLEQLHPQLAAESRRLMSTTSFAVSPEQIDLLSVVKASQAISRDVIVDKLVRSLLDVVLEHSGAEKGYLIVPRDGAPSIEAEAALDVHGTRVRTALAAPVTSSAWVARSIVQYVWRTGESVVLDDAVAERQFSDDEYIARHRPRSVLCLPILRHAEVVALLYLENNVLPGAFTPAHLSVLELLAAQAAISLENAQFVAREHAARSAAEDAERRAAFLAEASAVLGESLDIAVVLERLAKLVVGGLAEWCAIDLVEEGRIQRVGAVHTDGMREVLDEYQRRYPPRWSAPHASVRAMTTGETILRPELSEADLREFCEDEEHFRLVRALGTRTALSTPLLARGRVVGAITLGSAQPSRRFGRADVELAEELSRRAAIAIDNAHLYRQAQEAVRLRDEFLRVASHELNTPLTALMLSLQSMRGRRSGKPPEREVMLDMAGRAERHCARLTGLIRTLLDAARVERDELSLHPEQVDIATLVRDVMERFEPQLAHAQCVVSLTLGAPVVGRWDPLRIEQLVANLLDNAIKFGVGNSIEIAVEREGEVARLSVTDHGIGIAPDRQARIFERFERGVPTQHYGGLGLGLYMCRLIAEAHGGSIRVESRLGEGATFTVELPCADLFGAVNTASSDRRRSYE
jgi:predicted ATPase/signal transduction histidine kinase